MRKLTDKEARAKWESIYRDHGSVVFNCRYRHDIGEVFTSLNEYLHDVRWRIVGESNPAEFLAQGSRLEDAIGGLFYRAEACD